MVKILSVAFILVSLTGCERGRGRAAPYTAKPQLCTQEFLNTYNRLKGEEGTVKALIETSAYSANEKLERLEPVLADCEKFKADYADLACRVEADGRVVSNYKASNVNPVCKAVAAFVTENKRQSPSKLALPLFPDAPPATPNHPPPVRRRGADPKLPKPVVPTTIPELPQPLTPEDDEAEPDAPAPQQPVETVTELARVKVRDAWYNYEFVVKDAQKAFELMSKSGVFAVDGRLVDVITLLTDSTLKGRPHCSANNLEKVILRSDQVKGKFSIMSSDEEQKSTSRDVSISFLEHGVGLVCGKDRLHEDFTLGDLQDALAGIIEIQPIKREPLETKIAAGPDGYCTPEFLTAAKELNQESIDFVVSNVALSADIQQAPAPERHAMQRDLAQKGRRMLTLCNDFEGIWGDFSCLAKHDQRSGAFAKTAPDLKAKCDIVRDQFLAQD